MLHVVTRHDVEFSSDDERCAAWFYPPRSGSDPAPVVVLGIGLGSIKEMGLDRYATAFQEHGYAALAFDHRSFGASTGEPRQVIDVARQLDDWRAAIAFARTRPGVDPARVVVWGTSFGGGHALTLAAEQPPGVVAAMAQCPFTDGIASAAAMSPLSALRVGPRALADLVGARLGRRPIMIPTAGPPHTAALMTSHDAVTGFLALVPPEASGRFVNRAAARIGLRIMGYRPGRRLRRARVPIFAAVCRHDTVAPPRAALRQLRRAPDVEIRTYETGHFAIYQDPWCAPAVADQLDFLERRVPVGG
nr:alpha/beta fold hydrolase [Aeromicrobium sp. Root472D3]